MRREHGQAAALSVLFLTVLLLSAAAVIDVGSWMREDRDTQRAADAAALAGAQELPEDHAAAEALALEYSGKNGGGVLADDVNFETTVLAGDTIAVDVDRPADSFFAKIVGIDSVEVGSTAKARAGVPSAAQYVAPIVVNVNHPQVSCLGPRMPCFNDDAELTLDDLHGPGSGDAAGAFGLLNLHPGATGAPGTEELASWMAEGFDGLMEPGIYKSAPSALFNSSQMSEALSLRTGTEVLFPIYDPPILGSGSGARYNIIGWIGFYIEDYDNRGSNGTVDGYFTRVVWRGVLSTTSSTTPDFGVRTVALID
jgi:Flp pilus assembly protein TadG